MFSRKTVLVIALAGIPLTSLTSCAPEPEVAKNTTTQSSKSPSPSTRPTEPEPSSNSNSNPELHADAIGADCNDIFPAQRLYDFDPNLGVVSSAVSIASPVVTKQKSLDGLFCDVVHLSTGNTTQFGVVRLNEQSARVQGDTISGLPTSGKYQVSTTVVGNFSQPTGQFVDGKFWVSVSSAEFASASDASFWSKFIDENLPR